MLTTTLGRNWGTEWLDNLPKITQQVAGKARSPQGEDSINKPHPAGKKPKKYQVTFYCLILK